MLKFFSNGHTSIDSYRKILGLKPINFYHNMIFPFFKTQMSNISKPYF